MFEVGDHIIYSSHGICEIDNICEKTLGGVKRKYYELHPVKDSRLKISIPVDSDKVIMMEPIQKDEAEEILKLFSLPGIDWIEASSERSQVYSDIIKKGNRKETSKIVNTLMRRRITIELSGRKFSERDKKLLTYVEGILFRELAHSLNTTFEDISEKVTNLINESQDKIS